MQSLKPIANQLNNTFWTGSDSKTVYGIFLWSFEPFTNTDYPYQLVFRFYTPGYNYIADTVQLKGGLALNGQFTYGNGIFGTLISSDKIKWSNGEEWDLIKQIPIETHLDKYSDESIRQIDNQMTSFIDDRMNVTYRQPNPDYQY
jgi:hypothetical protein